MKYIIVHDGKKDTWGAHSIQVRDGTLELWSDIDASPPGKPRSRLIAAFAPGAWSAMWEEPNRIGGKP